MKYYKTDTYRMNEILPRPVLHKNDNTWYRRLWLSIGKFLKAYYMQNDQTVDVIDVHQVNTNDFLQFLEHAEISLDLLIRNRLNPQDYVVIVGREGIDTLLSHVGPEPIFDVIPAGSLMSIKLRFENIRHPAYHTCFGIDVVFSPTAVGASLVEKLQIAR